MMDEIEGAATPAKRSQDVERRLSLSVLPADWFAAFRAAVETPGKTLPGLAAAANASEGVLRGA